MENWNVVSVECIDTLDPKVVRITILVAGIHYGIDIPASIYPDLAGSLGWPTNPCSE